MDPVAELMSDANKLRLLADWFDVHDNKFHKPPLCDEVQRDLRRIADSLDKDASNLAEELGIRGCR